MIKRFLTIASLLLCALVGGAQVRWVDLGLSVEWAECNLGATYPEQYGNYYAWGEVAPKATYSKSNYTLKDKPSKSLQGTAIVDQYGKLAGAYGVATKTLGAGSRMPSAQEMNELVEKCTWTQGSVNGVKGYMVTGPNGNSIFLPNAGRKLDNDLDFAGYYGTLWSSDFGVDADGYNVENGAWSLYWGDRQCMSFGDRHKGRPIRAVRDKQPSQKFKGVNTEEMVDLGLSVKWANKNVWARSVWEKGYLSATFPSVANGFRFPGTKELKELMDKCTYFWNVWNGVQGYVFIGPNGNRIFIPFNGTINNDSWYYYNICEAFFFEISAKEYGGDGFEIYINEEHYYRLVQDK